MAVGRPGIREFPDSEAARSSLRGQILIATPAIGDPRFARTVIFLCAHNQDHAMGLILNRPMGGLRVPDLLEHLEIPCSAAAQDRPVRAGGPMEQDRGFVLHTEDFHLEDATVRVTGGVGLTATREVLAAMGGADGPREAVLALGYAGWGPGQLEDELRRNAWLVCPTREELVFDDTMEGKWERALAAIGVDPALLSTTTGRA